MVPTFGDLVLTSLFLDGIGEECYPQLAEQMGITEDELLDRVGNFHQDVIRRVQNTLNSYAVPRWAIEPMPSTEIH